MKSRKLVAVAATFAILSGVLAGCSSDSEETAAPFEDTAWSGTQSPSPSVPSNEPTSPTGGLLPAAVGQSQGTQAGASPDVIVGVDSNGLPQYQWNGITIEQTPAGRPVIRLTPRIMPKEVEQRTLIAAPIETPAVANSSDLLVVNFETVKLSNGKPISSSWANDKTTTFSLDSVAPGWTAGMLGMKVGERRLLVIPGELTLGRKGTGLPEVEKEDAIVAVVDLVASIPSTTEVNNNTVPAPTPSPSASTPLPNNAVTPRPNSTATAPAPSPSASSTATAPAFQPLPLSMFGLHIPWAQQSNVPTGTPGEYTRWDGQWPDVDFGTLRLWDTRTTWAALEPTKGNYVWNQLDGELAQATQNGINDITLVVAGTPAWAAKGEAPESALWIGPNSAAPPASNNDWIDFLTALATRYKGKIDYYQIGNEPNSPKFWAGTPEELASLVTLAKNTIKKIDPKAKIIAPPIALSEKVKAGAGDKWWAGLKKANWPVDAVAFNIYPNVKGGVEYFADQTILVKKNLAKQGWNGELWVTEMSYVDRTGKVPAAQTQRELVARSYWAARDLGITKLYWYMWAPAEGSGTDWWMLYLQSGSAGALGYQDAYDAGRDTENTAED